MIDNEEFWRITPLGNAIGMTLLSKGDRVCSLKIDYSEHLVGDPDTGIIHGGVITALLDNSSGFAVRCHPEWAEGQSMATLDLRIDYMRPATPHRELIGSTECYKITKNIAFVRGIAHQGDPDDPIATSVASFMLGTPNEPRS